MSKIYDTPSKVSVEGGTVLIDGPDGVAVAVTAESAAETSDRLLHAATMAAGHLVEARRIEDERKARNLKR